MTHPPTRPNSPNPTPSYAGRYELRGELGGGGMGAVFLAHDPDCDRPLAVKVLLARHQTNPAAIARFQSEARLTAKLQHPGVPPVYEIGQLGDGRPFFAMKLIQGQTLGQLLWSRRSPSDNLPRLLLLFGSVCRTMGYAHSQGVIHRDLKPSNVMIGPFGEVQVMDWGLAGEPSQPPMPEPTRADEEPGEADTVLTTSDPDLDPQTVTGQGMGTPAYMPPEQARGEWGAVDARSDVFSLGGILCELLTGEPPYTGGGLGEVIGKACKGDLGEALARLYRCGADAELIGLTQRCLAARREDRPANAGEVADAVERFEAGVVDRLRKAELARLAADEQVGSGRRSLQRMSLLALIVAGLGAFGTWWAMRGQP